MKNRLFKISIVLIFIIVVSSCFIPKKTLPSADTRVILDHTYKTYIAPMCFETSNATNFLGESTLGYAQEQNYQPHSSCTENALKAENDTLFKSILKEIGIIDKKWDNW